MRFALCRNERVYVVSSLKSSISNILETHVGGTNDGLGLSLDTLEVTRFGAVELDLGGTELIVRPSGRNLLCKCFEVTYPCNT